MKELFNKLSERWTDTATLLLGLWLIASPWVLGYAAGRMAAGNAWLTGAALVVVAAVMLATLREWLEVVGAALGAWLIASPWVLGFAAVEAAVWNQVVVGIVVGALAIWAALGDRPKLSARA